MGKMPDGKVMYTLDGRPVTEEPEGSPEEKHYKRIINQVSGYVREVCQQMTQTVPKAIVHCMVMQVGRTKVVGGCSGGDRGRGVGCGGGGWETAVSGDWAWGRMAWLLVGACSSALMSDCSCEPPLLSGLLLMLCLLPLPGCLPSLQSKDKLLEDMQAGVAGDQEAALKRLLGEDEAVMKRRETLTLKLDMLKKAQAELTTVDV
jgi:hypothetical protein